MAPAAEEPCPRLGQASHHIPTGAARRSVETAVPLGRCARGERGARSQPDRRDSLESGQLTHSALRPAEPRVGLRAEPGAGRGLHGPICEVGRLVVSPAPSFCEDRGRVCPCCPPRLSAVLASSLCVLTEYPLCGRRCAESWGY